MCMEKYSEIEKYLDENKHHLFDLLSKMIRIDTQNDRTSANEEALALFLRDEYKKLGIESELYAPDEVEGVTAHPDYFGKKDFTGRKNITARIKGKTGSRTLMLAGHSDTMPVGDTSLWTVPPLSGIMKDGRIFGRGACDDKYALASMLFIAGAFKKMGVETDCDVLLTAYVDEEFGGGSGALSAAIKYPCDFYLNLDCKNFDIWRTAAGGQRVVIYLKHPKVQHSCELIMEGIFLAKREIDAFGKRRVGELKNNPNFNDSIIPETSLRFMNMATGINTNDRNVGHIDFAFYTDKPSEDIRKELQSLYDAISEKIKPLGLEIDRIVESSRLFRYGEVDRNNPMIKLIKEVGEDVLSHPIYDRASCLSDLSNFLSVAPGRAVAFGIGRDFDVYGGAHLPDEFIECENLLNFSKILARVILEWDKGDL